MDLALLQQSHKQLTAASIISTLRAAYPDENVGWTWFADTYSEDGWYRLEIRIDETAPFPDIIKARAAGFAEGTLQGPHLYRYWTNYRLNEYRGRGEAPSQELYDWFDEQYGWMMRHVERATGWTVAMLRGSTPPLPATATATSANPAAAAAATAAILTATQMIGNTAKAAAFAADGAPNSDTEGAGGGGASSDGSADGDMLWSLDRRYWVSVGLVAAQFEGLTAGFWSSVAEPHRNMTWHELYALNAVGDLYELNVLFPPSAERPPPPPPGAPPRPTRTGEDAAAAAAGRAAVAEGLVRRRHYTPGHGEVGEYGYGELLDCSAIIKLDTGVSNGCTGRFDDDVGEGDKVDVDADAAAAAPSLRWSEFGSSHESGGSGGLRTRTGPDKARQRSQISDPRRKLSQVGAGEAATDSNPGAGARRCRRNFWAAHNTWRPYYDMVRWTWKVYDLPWAATGPLTVSSSPGLLHSKDDWYTTDVFVVMETTNGVYNKELYDLIQPKCVLMWQRVQQWMVLDVQQLQQPRPRSDVLWVLEQVPGRTVSKDVTEVLMEQGYWASYNVPYFPEIYNLTGYPQPSIYTTCPRAMIFSREQSQLSSLTDIQTLMRLNRYQTDPLSLGLPNNAIAARYDLPAAIDGSGQPHNWTRRAYGAVDAKIVDLDSFRARRTYVINGPTADDQPVFRWSTEPIFDAIRRDGCVDEFDFGWQSYESVVGPPPPSRLPAPRVTSSPTHQAV
ncbi:hypothetical protein VOLCADRAFT_86598 [Volvox carteri f. nagariensis]|uniref:Phospholipase B-like n=1 Tax=Volvox carteri f. nagariensis TaxID=3068 RepID=D8TJ35_VOLCA|nr:uncharacterized protein VOLCADRAFT_86598 [Volvox carteri f. nagariensis]EFJ52468.1 hypothetical protein VOLCADRAFT_86598 [Volvox carteri f. nagariensis]|eukprot:XP_002946541.1 hypothetical protein VOLCADRAFT_86598 [Volvox carteri f. nagariensis]